MKLTFVQSDAEQRVADRVILNGLSLKKAKVGTWILPPAHSKDGKFTGDGEPPHADAEYHTQEFVLANVARRTAYTGSEYPLSSLVRLFKYAKRDKLTRVGVAQAAMKIMKDILVRGYENYDDFKSQLDAVDLSVPELREAWELYRTCCDKGLVANMRKEN